MPSITTWARLETPTVSDDVAAGLAARLHDPLWLLARQWQAGEFQGEDGGTPIQARWRGTVSPLTRYHLGPIPPDTSLSAPRFDASQAPLETFVERQPVQLAPSVGTVRLGLETGRHFLHLLTQQPTSRDYADAFRLSYALRPAETVTDSATASYVGLMAGRALDGRPRPPTSPRSGRSAEPGCAGPTHCSASPRGRRMPGSRTGSSTPSRWPRGWADHRSTRGP